MPLPVASPRRPADESVVVSLVGESVERALECSPATIDFGSLTVGGTAGDCRSRNLTCENTANIPATIWGWSVTEDSSSTFSVEASEVVELAPGSAGPPHVLRLPITFCPRVGRHEAVLTVDIDEGAVRVPITGRGTAPDIELSTNSLNFSFTPVGTSENRTLTIRNRGDAPLDVANLVGHSEVFSASPNGTRVLQGRRADITITFRPPAAQTYEGRFTIESNDPDEPSVTLNVIGSGI